MSQMIRAVLLVVVATSAAGQQYIVSTPAGGAPPPTPMPGNKAFVIMPSAVAVDREGNAYFVASFCVFKVDPNGTMHRIAGNSRPGYSGDGGQAIDAQIFTGVSNGITVDASGNVYFSDKTRVRRISPSGSIVTVAGNGTGFYSGEGVPATTAGLSQPFGLVVDSKGTLYIADGSRVRKVSPAGIMTTIAGTGKSGYSGDGGPAINAQLYGASGLALDSQGNLFVADYSNSAIRKIAIDGTITTVAGGGTSTTGEGVPATEVRLSGAMGITVDAQDNLLLAESSRIRRISPAGIITTVAGGSASITSGDGSLPFIIGPRSLAIDAQGNFVFQDSQSLVRKLSPDRVIRVIAGGGAVGAASSSPIGGSAQLGDPQGIAVDSQHNLFVADSLANRVWKISPAGVVTTAAGTGVAGFGGDDGSAQNAMLRSPSGLAMDAEGNLLICDVSNHRIRKVTPAGIISTIAGTGSRGYSGDGGPATAAQLNLPQNLAIDSLGNFYFFDSGTYRVRKVAKDGTISTVAGTGSPGYSGDGGLAAAAQVQFGGYLACDMQGNVYIADENNQRVRKISTNGIITTIAGTGTPGHLGDGGAAAKAQLFNPAGVAVDSTGNVYISDSYLIRKVSTNGIISTIAGGSNPNQAHSGDGGPATSARFAQLEAMTVDDQGSIYVVDAIGMAVRRLQPTTRSVLLSAVVDAASQSQATLSPGKIVVLYGGGLGPASLVQNQPTGGVLPAQLAGTAVSFNGISAPIVYTSSTQVAAIVPYACAGSSVQVTVTFGGETSAPLTLPFLSAAPSVFTLNQSGGGQAAAINAVDGSFNTAATPAKVGEFVSLFVTGEGLTTPSGADGKIALGAVLPQPILPVTATVGGVPAMVQYAGAAPVSVAGLMQVNIQIPKGIQPGGYVPVVVSLGAISNRSDAVWIAVQ